MQRPQIENFFPNGLCQAHSQYSVAPDLFRYSQSLDNYIDHIKDKIEKTKELPDLSDFDFKRLRLEKKLTLRQVEEKTGISNAYLSQLENGKIKDPGYSTVKKLVELYGIEGLNEWNSTKLIGEVRKRFDELIEKEFDWSGFYNGWIEGRFEMLAEIKGWKKEKPTQVFVDYEKNPIHEIRSFCEIQLKHLQRLETRNTLSDHGKGKLDGLKSISSIIKKTENLKEPCTHEKWHFINQEIKHCDICDENFK